MTNKESFETRFKNIKEIVDMEFESYGIKYVLEIDIDYGSISNGDQYDYYNLGGKINRKLFDIKLRVNKEGIVEVEYFDSDDDEGWETIDYCDSTIKYFWMGILSMG